MNRVAVLGLGAMGERMARNLVRAGYEVVVFNRSPEKVASLLAAGAKAAASPRDAAAESDIIVSMVTDDEASRAIWLDESRGAVRGISKGKVAVEMSTLTPAWVRELAGVVEGAGGEFVDAPVVGSRPQAEAGQLVVLAGGEEQTIKEVAHVFAAIAAATHRVGDTGTGAAAKLVVNYLFATQVVAMAELLSVTRRFGIDDATLTGVLGSLPVTSPGAIGALKLMLSGNYAPMFPISLVAKDLHYFARLANEVSANVPIGNAVKQAYQRAGEAGFGGDNIHGVYRAYAA
jgi:3-hydroxyisobutyrate dehydrogenase